MQQHTSYIACSTAGLPIILFVIHELQVDHTPILDDLKNYLKGLIKHRNYGQGQDAVIQA